MVPRYENKYVFNYEVFFVVDGAIQTFLRKTLFFFSAEKNARI